MADATLTRRSALEGHNPAGRYGAIKGDAPGITVQEQPALAIVQVDAWADQIDTAMTKIEKAVGTEPVGPVKGAEGKHGTTVLSIGPGRWLVVEREDRDLMAVLAATILDDTAILVDQGHGRVCWRVSGPNLRELLVKGSTIDFDEHAFGPGDCVGTALGHFTVTVYCRDETTVDIFGARSFAVDLNHWIHEASLEFGLEVLEPAEA